MLGSRITTSPGDISFRPSLRAAWSAAALSRLTPCLASTLPERSWPEKNSTSPPEGLQVCARQGGNQIPGQGREGGRKLPPASGNVCGGAAAASSGPTDGCAAHMILHFCFCSWYWPKRSTSCCSSSGLKSRRALLISAGPPLPPPLRRAPPPLALWAPRSARLPSARLSRRARAPIATPAAATAPPTTQRAAR